MPTSLYNFQYVPLTGRLPGKSFVSQTEQAINGLAQYVYDNSTNYEAVKSIAQKAEEDSSSALEYSEEALDKAQTALETVGRAYIKTTSAVDLNDYFDSELLLILSTESTNLPSNITGYLTVMSSDTHDYCIQVYIGVDGSVYKRTATISDNTPTFGAWSETPITLSSLQTILANYTTVDASNIGVNAQTDNSIAWGNAIGGGEIANGEQRLITGGTVYPLSQNVAQNTSNIATNTADIVQNTGGISANSKRIGNIEKLLQGNLYDYQTDSTSAYTKSVPSGALPYAGLEKVGGKTIVWNQVFDLSWFTSQYPNGTNGYGLYYTRTDDVFHMTGTATRTPTEFYFFLNQTVVAGHKYLFATKMSSSDSVSRIWVVDDSTSTALARVDSANDLPYSVFTAGGTYTSVKYYFQSTEALGAINAYIAPLFVDLTLMFGSGNEPTAQQFADMFPAPYYAYSAPTLLSAGVTEVVSKDANNATLQTYSIPASVQALEGYGWSAGTAYNYIDFERKKFVKRVEKIVIDGNAISFTGGAAGSNGNYRFNTDTMDIGIVNGGGNITNVISLPISYDYDAVITNATTTTRNGIVYTQSRFFIEFADPAIATTTSGVNTWLQSNPITMYYELATPVETDISQYLTDDNLIQVESGGTLTFPNSNGDDYRLPVPNEEEYMIDLQEAINNG